MLVPRSVLRWIAAGTVVASCTAPSAGSGSVTVVAASSLTETFTELARRFERVWPGTTVQLSFASSSTAVAQVRAGAPVDVVATADAAVVDDLAADGLVADGSVFARNRLTLVVAEGNPHRVRSPADLTASGLDLVVCAPEVPCGRLAAEAVRTLAPDVRPRSHGANVKAVLTRVALGEADAGLVYATDARVAADRVDEVPLAAPLTTDYAVAAVLRATPSAAAIALVEFLRSSDAWPVLAAAGFEAP